MGIWKERAQGCQVASWANEMALKLIVVMDAQLYEDTNMTELCTLNG